MRKSMLVLILLVSVGAAWAQTGNSSGIPTDNWIGYLTGTYLISYQGSVLIPTGSGLPAELPGVMLGIISIDSKGNLSGSVTVIGTQVEEFDIAGEVTLSGCCAGTVHLAPTSRLTGIVESKYERFVFLYKEKELRTIMVDAGVPGVTPLILGTWKQMSPVPNAATY